MSSALFSENINHNNVESQGGTYFAEMLTKYNVAFDDIYVKSNPIYQILANTFRGSLYLLGYKQEVEHGLLKASFLDNKDNEEESDVDDSFEPIMLDSFLPQISDKDQQGRRKIRLFDKHDVARMYIDYEATRLCGRLSTDRQIELADAAAALFPEVGDSNSWYQKSVTVNGKSITCRGPGHAKMRELTQKAVRLKVFESHNSDTVDQTYSESLIKLQNEVIVNDNVRELYISIRAEMQEFFCKTELSEIFEYFKFLKTQEGLNLILSHFDECYPDKANKFVKKMPHLVKLIYNYVLQSNKNDVQKYVKVMNNKPTGDNQLNLGLLMLPLLMPPTKCRQKNVERAPTKSRERKEKKRKVVEEEDDDDDDSNSMDKRPKIWVAKPDEMLENFIHLIEIDGVSNMYRDEIEKEEESKIAEHRDKLIKRYRDFELPLTSHIIVFGNTTLLKKAILYIAENRFKFVGANCALKATEACYKVIKLFGKDFPKAASAVWQYIEWKVYDTSVPGMLQTTINFDRSLNTPVIPGNSRKKNPPQKRKL